MENQGSALLIYDGECPFCSRYVQMLRLRDSIDLQLLDARLLEKGGGATVLHEVIAACFDLNEGMVLKLGEEFYHGDHCIHVLALLSSSVGWTNRCFAAIFRSRAAARVLYPVLRFFRNLTLRCLGRNKLDLSS
ncbi:MAG: DCC1-like thiol-disulfide oxidoreductase family protein [Pseudomonadales bacterium]